jgi:hypothetical protein
MGAVAVDSPPIRRSTRATSQQPGVRDDIVNNPQLPKLETQQSYAYGATKTPNLPQQLGNPGDLQQIVDTIDGDVEQGVEQIQSQVSQQRRQTSSSPPPSRQQRGSSQEPTQVPTQKSQRSSQPTVRQPSTRDKHARVEAWADSLDESQLDNVPEEDEDESELPDDATHRDTDPSSFPDVAIDHSYNYERGLRRPRPAVVVRKKGLSVFQRSCASLKAAGTGVKRSLSNASRSCTAWFGRMGNVTAKALQNVPDSPLVAGTITLLVATSLVAIAGFLFCSVYSRLLCSPSSTSIIATNMQKFCGICTASPTTFNFSPEDSQDLGKITAAISALNQQMQAIEQRLSRWIDSNHAALEAEMNTLKIQHNTLSTLLHDMQYSQPAQVDSNVASPLIPKINFFAPSNGALVHPLLSSPTRARQRRWPTRLFMKVTGLTRYQSNPPVMALEPWQDVGDCWCGPDVPLDSASDVLRLAVTTREMLFPTELVIEHFPAQGSLRPDTAPKTLELWADFGHLGYDEWQKLQLADMQDDNVLGPRYAKLGQMEYVTDPGSNHVQRFRLDVNQRGLLHYAMDFTLRVKNNYGAEFGCLYRVRLHGLPLSAKEGIQYSDGRVSRSGYATEE